MRALLWTLTTIGVVAALMCAAVASTGYFSASSWTSLFSALFAERGAEVTRNVAYGSGPRQRLDVYRAPGKPGGPIILFLYGGSWRFGDKSTYGFLGAALAARGITTVIPDYRLYPEVRFPAFVEDAAAAYAWVARHLAQKGRPIVLMGHSAGAHMAALLALDPRYIAGAGEGLPQPRGLIGLAGPYAFDPTTWPSTRSIFRDFAKEPEQTRPVAFAGPHAPPTLLMHGKGDDTVRLYNMRELAKALSSAGVSVRALELENVGHIGILTAIAWPLRWRAPVLEEVVSFVRSLRAR